MSTKHSGKPLTGRQRDVARLVARGLSNKAVGEQLGIAAATVRVHLVAIFQRVGVRNRTELALWITQGAKNVRPNS